MISITDAAIKKIQNIIEEEGGEKLALRIAVEGGGCSGFKYQFSLIDTRFLSLDDLSFKFGGVCVIIDPISANYLQGSILDFKKRLFSSEFVLQNPNIKNSCGCGNSFST